MNLPYKANITKQVVERIRSLIRDPGQIKKKKQRRVCSCCGYQGAFISMRKTLPEMRCPNCASRPRDRLLGSAFIKYGVSLHGKRILHFSAEPNLFRRLQKEPEYVSGDIKKSKYAKYYVDVTDIKYPDDHFDIIICNHVMEHVPDHLKGFRECYRVLKSGGTAFFSVPYEPDREKTWYPPEDMPAEEVDRICGWDHKRLYGQDFPDIVATAGFKVETFLPKGEDVEIYKTTLTDPIFIARKAA